MAPAIHGFRDPVSFRLLRPRLTEPLREAAA
jgi:hypothetical protein